MSTESKLEKQAVSEGGKHAFLTNLIDYAGLFPPANLPLDAAITNYKKYKNSKDSWMLGPFIIPAVRLNELSDYISLFSCKQPLTLSVIGTKSGSAEVCKETIRADFERISAFSEQHGDAVKVEAFELPLPSASPSSDLLASIASEAEKHGLRTFCEVITPLGPDWKKQMLEAMDKVAEHNATGTFQLGMKLRTGGITADAFPAPELVAAVLIGARDRNLALKFTAGLHHPIRMYREEVQTKMHGFLNVFVSGMLSHYHSLDESTAAAILEEEKTENFLFTDKEMAWKKLSIPVTAIAELREKALCSYGSCSFDEPREDLETLNIYKL